MSDIVINVHDLGDEISLFVNFTDDDDVAVNPDNVTLRILDPAGTMTVVASPSNPITGRYEHILAIALDGTLAGAWTYRFEGVGTAPAAVEKRFNVRPSPFYP